MTRHVDVPANAMIGMLTEAGFTPYAARSGDELVYHRPHARNPSVLVLVYTSIRRGAARARGRGADAIRVVTIYADGERSFGIGKQPRVYRTGSVDKVLSRTLERMRAAYADGSAWLRSERGRPERMRMNRVNPG